MPKADLMIVTGGAPMEGAPTPETTEPDFSEEVAQGEASDSELMAQVSPQGRFSSKALNALVKASNVLLPAFGQDPDYPRFDPGTYEVFPEDFVRVLSMFSAAARDAAVEDVIAEDLVFDFSSATDDNDLQIIAGRINALGKARSFKKWLKDSTPVDEKTADTIDEEASTKEAPKSDMSDDEVDDLFASRL